MNIECRTPASYQGTEFRGVLPVEEGKIAFSLGGGVKTAIRVRISVYDALRLSSALVNYIALSQSPRSSEIKPNHTCSIEQLISRMNDTRAKVSAYFARLR
ncbi:MAG: hypothetical protein LBI35_09460 [Burkholderiales bacterium]|jgi:hypothetical protein|nr:hypothetical protein [Burkholderiales bacterium]